MKLKKYSRVDRTLPRGLPPKRKSFQGWTAKRGKLLMASAREAFEVHRLEQKCILHKGCIMYNDV
jgi:hypothetical protein